MIGGQRWRTGKAASEGYVDAINIRQVFIEGIIARFKMDVLEDKKTGRHADSQPENIDQAINSIFNQVPVRDFKIVPEHRQYFRLPLIYRYLK
jgi:hypothetical protein